MPSHNGKIPQDPSWCSYCLYPNLYKDGNPCSSHRGPGGKAIHFVGDGSYEPSTWVLGIVGKEFRSVRYDLRGCPVFTFKCTGYDPRHGFWMQDIENPEYRTNVSERAIGRTYLLVKW